MPIFLDTTGLASLAIGVCDRCKMKVSFTSLVSDPNFPGLRVCEDRGCKDQFDPYRLPARKTERINLRFPRPDVSVATNPSDILSTGVYGGFVLSSESSGQTPQDDGNLDGLEITPEPR